MNLQKLYDNKEYHKIIKKLKDKISNKEYDYETFLYLSSAYFKIKNYNESIKYAKMGLLKYSNKFAFYQNLGISYLGLGMVDDAKRALLKALELNPNINPQVYTNLAKIYYFNREFFEAFELFCKAKIKYPKDMSIDYDMSFYYLYLGEYLEAYDIYRVRYSLDNIHRKRKLPRYDILLDKDSDITNKQILISHEQGFGDSIQMVRFALLLKRLKAKKVYFQTPKVLARLYKYNFSKQIKIVDEEEKIGVHNFIPIMDLPYILDIPSIDIPFNQGYMRVNKKESYEFYKSYFIDNGLLNIGIVFRGNPEHSNDEKRSIDSLEMIEYLEPIINRCNIYSLQYQPTKREKSIFKKYNIVDISSDFKDFYDTALALDNLDILITVDTSVAHLAGAMNKKTLLLLPYFHDTRWGMDSKKTNWYSSITLYKQDKSSNWKSLFGELVSDINKILV